MGRDLYRIMSRGGKLLARAGDAWSTGRLILDRDPPGPYQGRICRRDVGAVEPVRPADQAAVEAGGDHRPPPRLGPRCAHKVAGFRYGSREAEGPRYRAPDGRFLLLGRRLG